MSRTHRSEYIHKEAFAVTIETARQALLREFPHLSDEDVVVIGKGMFGVVFAVGDKAYKVIDETDYRNYRPEGIHEVAIMQALHPHTPDVYAIVETADNFSIIAMELVPHTKTRIDHFPQRLWTLLLAKPLDELVNRLLELRISPIADWELYWDKRKRNCVFWILPVI